MTNVVFELDKLRHTLERRGLDVYIVDAIVQKARQEINRIMEEQGQAAMELAIEEGVNRRSPEFINELKLNNISMELTTTSGNMDFSEPPFPMLPSLLKNAKPMKDGSGVYKVVPVGQPGKDRRLVSTDIAETWKQINAERVEASRAQRQRVSPGKSKGTFRTATSKQSAATQWVKPAQEKDFTEQVQGINTELTSSIEEQVRDVIREYEEAF